MRIAIVGSRDVKGFTLERMLPHIPPEATELVSGGAYGIDQMAEQAAQVLGLPIRIFRPDYKTNGRLAPLVRNRPHIRLNSVSSRTNRFGSSL